MKYLVLIIAVCSVLPLRNTTQQQALTAQNRAFMQMNALIPYMNEQRLVEEQGQKKFIKFSSTNDIDGFVTGFENLWKNKAQGADKALMQIDSYVYSLIERSLSDQPWSQEFIWKKYMLPAFFHDVEYLLQHESNDAASFMNPANAGNIFSYAMQYDLPQETWTRLYQAYLDVQTALQKIERRLQPHDSTLQASIQKTQGILASYRPVYTVLNDFSRGQYDAMFVSLAEFFSSASSPKSLAMASKKLALQYAVDGKRDRAIAVLDLVVRSTIDADVPRDSLLAWYTAIDPAEGQKRFETVAGVSKASILVPSGKRVKLSGTYTDFLTGKQINLASLQGKTVFIDFWATWCAPCREEIPELNAFNKKIAKRKDWVFLSICSDAVTNGLDEVKAKEFSRKMNVAYPAIYDKPETSLSLQFKIESYPTKLVINSDGELLERSQKNAPMTLKVIEEFFDSLQE